MSLYKTIDNFKKSWNYAAEAISTGAETQAGSIEELAKKLVGVNSYSSKLEFITGKQNIYDDLQYGMVTDEQLEELYTKIHKERKSRNKEKLIKRGPRI